MSISAKELRRRGVSDEEMRTARILQDAQRRTGSPVKTLGQIFSGQPATQPTRPADLTERQLRKRGRIGQAALLLDQEALTDPDFIRKTQLRSLAHAAKELANIPAPLEYDFFKGNRMIADEFHDAVRDRLRALNLTTAKMGSAVMVLAEICRHLPWEDHVCPRTAADLADILGMNHSDMARSLTLLEEIGAIRRCGAPIGLAINWGRSALEARDAARPLEQITRAREEGLLAGLMFSGCSGEDTPWGVWQDSHMPQAPAPGLDHAAPGSLMTAEAVAAAIAAAGTGLAFIGGKLTVRPSDAGLEQRLGLNRDLLRLLAASA